jgi:peptidase C39-like protein
MAFSLVRYSQQDPRWKDEPLGNGNDTIGRIGCALTSVAMLSSGWGFSETPDTLNRKLKDAGGFIKQAIVWGAVSKLYPSLRCTGLTICGNSTAPLSDIGGSLDSGQPLIVEVDFSPAAGLQTHWVLLYRRIDNDYLMLDPWPYPADTGQVNLSWRYSHGRNLQRAIKAIAWYECSSAGPLPQPKPGPLPVETDLYVWPLASVTAGLRLHPEPRIDSPASYAEMPGVRLNVIEEKQGALAKIGQQGQWIRIRDPQGRQGYVAAWYVEQVPADAPAPTPIPPPASEPKKFQVSVLKSVGPLGLAVRETPSPGGSKVNIEKPGTRLTVIEPASTGMPKIGVVGQWLAIKATNNKRGYVAAQYVQLIS